MSIEEKFLAAVDIIESLPSDGTFQPSEDLMLKLYAYYMQATQGPCRVPKPSVWYYSSRIKWNAWNELGNMQKELAMEKYVEELTKVIETMSYNENVSKFMSLIGPFYEVVATDEIDAQSEKRLNYRNPTEYVYPIRKLEDQLTFKSELSQMSSHVQNNSTSDELSSYSSESPLKESSKITKSDVSDTRNTRYIPRKKAIDMFKAKNNSKKPPFGTQQDMLILTFINLQNSLEEIVKKLDNLQSLAKSADFNYEKEKEEETPQEWNLGYSGTAFALFWPIAVYLCSKSF